MPTAHSIPFSAIFQIAFMWTAPRVHAEEAVEDLHFASREIPKARVSLAQYYIRKGENEAAARELREFLPQASAEERATVEQWLSKLVAK